MRKIIFIALLLYYIATLTLGPKPANAQGTFSCQFWGDPANFIPNTCTLVSSNCEAGYKPDDCTLWIASQEQCHGVHQCVTETPADFGCSLTDALGQCIDPALIRCGAIYCCPEASDCNKIKEKQKNILPTPTPTPIPLGGTCGCQFNAWDLIDPCIDTAPPECPSGMTCQCQVELDMTGTAPIGCRPGTCILIPTIIPTPTGADKYGKCDPLMTATGCIAINIKCDKGYKAVVRADCKSCWCEFGGGIDIHGPCGKDITTAIGCIPVGTANEFIKWFLGRAILLAGGVAFLMMIAGAFLVIVSSGNPEKVKAGSQLITSAIAGLVFIIFSLFLLRLIGIEILQIPGL